MTDVILDTLLDTAKLIPFLFVTYLLMEYLEHRIGEKMQRALENGKRKWFIPVIGSLCGCVPQCGFSAAASGLFAGRVISMGTLIAIYLSTSDEMLPIMISHGTKVEIVFTVIGIKLVFGMICGIVIDLFARKGAQESGEHIHDLCEHDHCHCENGIWVSALRHTLSITIYIFLFVFVLNTAIFLIGEDNLKHIFLNIPVVGELISGLVGLIPNCAASVMITELYLEGVINFGSMMAGLFVGAGVGLLVLYRVNKNLKQNIFITALLYAAGVTGGLLIDLTGIFA
jgi:hypothetical protein